MQPPERLSVPGFIARRVATSDHISIAYIDAGPRDGQPIVLCHGLGANGEQFSADAVYFAQRGFRVLVPDLRGHGASTKPAGYRPEDFTITRMAKDMIAMLDHAGLGQVDWIGNSLGGIIALWILGNAPSRFRTFSTFGTTYDLSLPYVTAQAFPLTYGLLGRRLTATVTSQVSTRDPAAQAIVFRMISRFDPMVGWAVVKNVAHYDMRAKAHAFPRPILLIRGGRDYRVNAGLGPTLRAMEGKRNFTCVNVRQGGHLANLDATREWRRAMLMFLED